MKGSSPLTRGKPRMPLISVVSSGIIPAHAGKTSVSTVPASPGLDHPRSRGENVSVAAVAVTRPGSSPLTRGKLCALPSGACRGGIIPAHAGKTSRAHPTTCGPWDHPRSRGENEVVERVVVAVPGSSPLTRGKRCQSLGGVGRRGIIPAHAGKTRRHEDARHARRDHPRSRGENAWIHKETGLPWDHPRSRGENRRSYAVRSP